MTSKSAPRSLANLPIPKARDGGQVAQPPGESKPTKAESTPNQPQGPIARPLSIAKAGGSPDVRSVR